MRVKVSIAVLVLSIAAIYSVECTSSSSSAHHENDKQMLRGAEVVESTVPAVDDRNLVGLMTKDESLLKPKPSKMPSTTKPEKSNPACVSSSVYDAIDADIANLKSTMTNETKRVHFLGGIVRLVAHDFMDYDRNNVTFPMGPDGCVNVTHFSNKGLNDIWCDECPLTLLHKDKYSHISKADFWVAAANAVIRQTSVDNALDLKKTFLWGRKDAASCPGAADRLPRASSCTFVETVFLTRMGLSWKDAVVLMGAHTLGRGTFSFSRHDGLWEDSVAEAERFDNQYYKEMFTNSWVRKSLTQDWTTESTGSIPRMMLNTDLCLVFDIDDGRNCCAGDTCVDSINEPLTKCPVLSNTHARYEALEAVEEMLGDDKKINDPFYSSFMESWNKATTLGLSNLSPLKQNCP